MQERLGFRRYWIAEHHKHAGHCQRCDGSGDRTCRGGRQDDWGQWDRAPIPPARRRRALGALRSLPTWPRPRGHRSQHRARAASHVRACWAGWADVPIYILGLEPASARRPAVFRPAPSPSASHFAASADVTVAVRALSHDLSSKTIDKPLPHSFGVKLSWPPPPTMRRMVSGVRLDMSGHPASPGAGAADSASTTEQGIRRRHRRRWTRSRSRGSDGEFHSSARPTMRIRDRGLAHLHVRKHGARRSASSRSGTSMMHAARIRSSYQISTVGSWRRDRWRRGRSDWSTRVQCLDAPHALSVARPLAQLGDAVQRQPSRGLSRRIERNRGSLAWCGTECRPPPSRLDRNRRPRARRPRRAASVARARARVLVVSDYLSPLRSECRGHREGAARGRLRRSARPEDRDTMVAVGGHRGGAGERCTPGRPALG